MKRKNRNSGGKTSPRSHKSWLGTLFAKKTAPLISMKRRREAKARAAANRRAFLCIAIGVAAAGALFVMVLSVPPHISPEELAADVKDRKSTRLNSSHRL